MPLPALKVRRAGIVAVVVCLAAVAPAAAAPTKSTFSVPVTQPDEYGQPVELDTDVYLPDGPAPPGGFPLVVVFHGGGSNKDNGFDAGHAATYAEHGYASLIYSARGHGNSGGQTTVAGPKEVRDGFDVIAWALKKFGLDRRTIVLAGYSQGGLHVNLLQAYAADTALNPYGIRFAALEPGNTPDYVFNALVDHDVVKLSFGVGLLETYFAGSGPTKVSPQVDRWIATAAADRPELYGGELCDTSADTMRADLAARSIGCMPQRMSLPAYWMQAFDDELFPVAMATSMFDRSFGGVPASRLYLSMGGHGAPSAPRAVEQEKTEFQVAWLDHVLRGAPFKTPRVVYWTRDVSVAVPSGTTAWPDSAFRRHTASTWPPRGVALHAYGLGPEQSIPLNAPADDLGHDPVVGAAFSATPIGTAPSAPAPQGTEPGRVAVFATPPLTESTELAGAPTATVSWTPGSPDTQLVLKVLAQAPGGELTLLSRGVVGLRAAQPGAEQAVTLTGNQMSAELPAGTRIVTWITAGDASFYKAYPGSVGGTLGIGPQSALTVPVRDADRAVDATGGPGCRDRRAPVSRIRAAAVRGGRLRVSGTSLDRTCPGGDARHISRVFLAISTRSHGRCRFVAASGRLSHARSCTRRGWLEPVGASRWRLSIPARRLAPGRYLVVARAIDVRGNVERLGRANRRVLRASSARGRR